MKRSGFTLVEIMFVIFIVSFLLSIAVVQGVELRKRANESNAQANLKGIASAFEIYAAGNGGLYAQGPESNLQYLVSSNCAAQDFVSIGQVGNFLYSVGYINRDGYDIRAIAVSPALADHNYQISTGGLLKRSRTSAPGDVSFEIY